MATSGQRPGPYTEARFSVPGYFFRHIRCGSRRLVVTFETAGGKQYRPDPTRDGWGAGLVQRLGADGLFVMPAQVDWYRQPALRDFFAFLRVSGFFRGYGEVVTYGSSMGAYGALAFSGLCGAHRVVAFNPQSSLSPSIVPWEDRFPRSAVQDWNGPLADARHHIPATAEVTLLVDPFNRKDRRHAARIEAAHPRTRILRVPFVGHEVMNALRDMGVLSGLTLKLLEGRLEDRSFYAAARARRNLDVYRKHLDRAVARRARRAAQKRGPRRQRVDG